MKWSSSDNATKKNFRIGTSFCCVSSNRKSEIGNNLYFGLYSLIMGWSRNKLQASKWACFKAVLQLIEASRQSRETNTSEDSLNWDLTKEITHFNTIITLLFQNKKVMQICMFWTYLVLSISQFIMSMQIFIPTAVCNPTPLGALWFAFVWFGLGFCFGGFSDMP